MKRSVWKYLLKAGISIGLVVLLYRRVDPGALLAEFADLRVLPMVAFFGVLFFNTLISAFKWKVLLAADGIVLPLPRLLASYLIATFFNIFLPSNIGGDAYRVVDIARRTAKPVNTFASVFADRLSGFLALAVLGILFPLIGWTHVYDRRLLLPPLFVFGGLIGVLWILLHERGARWLLEMEWIARRPRMRDIGKRFLISVSSYRRKGPVVCKIMFISLFLLYKMGNRLTFPEVVDRTIFADDDVCFQSI